MRRFSFALALALALAVVPWFSNGPDGVESSRIPLGSGTSFGPIDGLADSVVALQWESGTPGVIEYRLDGGDWLGWADQAEHGEDGGPIPTGTVALFTEDADSIEIRTTMPLADAALFVVEGIGDGVALAPEPLSAAVDAPPIVTREAWGGAGCEDYSEEDPGWTNRVRVAVIHHTAGSNNHSASDVPEILQAICRYHTTGNGWTDIGYNFMIDRFGTIYEGRRSDTNGDLAIGAHVRGINSQTVGIALLGDFRRATPTAAQQASLITLLTWLSEQEHFNPDAIRTLVAPESEDHPEESHTLYGIAGHSDVSITSCPGSYCYNLLPHFRQAVNEAAGPRILFEDLTPDHPHVGDEVWGKFSFTEPMTWTLRVTDQEGVQRNLLTGHGRQVELAMTFELGIEELFYEITATTDTGYEPPPLLMSWHKHYQGLFSDDDESAAAASIEKIALAGITKGCDPEDLTLYCPGEFVTRAQMATFIVRALGLPATEVDHFTDDDGHALEASINAFAESGITYGCAEGLFCPEEIVPREQMAAFLSRALGLAPSEVNGFADVSGFFTPEINAMAAAGIIVACNEDGTLFCPTDLVTRESMAVFLDRGFLS